MRNLGRFGYGTFFSEIERLVNEGSDAPYLFLMDSLKFCDPAIYAGRILDLLRIEDQRYFDILAHETAYLQIKTAIPILEATMADKLAASNGDRFSWAYHSYIEVGEALETLKTGEDKYPEIIKSFYHQRRDWRSHYERFEDRFYDQVESQINHKPWGSSYLFGPYRKT